jgi:hypothetical protein
MEIICVRLKTGEDFIAKNVSDDTQCMFEFAIQQIMVPDQNGNLSLQLAPLTPINPEAVVNLGDGSGINWTYPPSDEMKRRYIQLTTGLEVPPGSGGLILK